MEYCICFIGYPSDIKRSWNTVFVLLDTLNQDIMQKNMSALFFCETKNRLPRHVNGSWSLESVLSAPSGGQEAQTPQIFFCCLKHGKTAIVKVKIRQKYVSNCSVRLTVNLASIAILQNKSQGQ